MGITKTRAHLRRDLKQSRLNLEMLFEDLTRSEKVSRMKVIDIGKTLINRMREGAGYSSKELSKKLGFSCRNYLDSIVSERWDHVPSLTLLSEVADVCHCDLIISYRPRHIAERIERVFSEAPKKETPQDSS